MEKVRKYIIDNKELMKEWNWEKNKELDPNQITSGFHKKVWWKCKKGHEWEAVIHPRLKGVGCPYCNGKKAIKGFNDFATLHPELLKEWDYDKNSKIGIKPDEMLIGSQKKVNWICSKGHKYDRSIYDRLHGRGNCPYCSKRKIAKGINDLKTTNPELIKEWDYEKNKIKPDEIATTYNKKVWWKCEKGHSWDSLIYPRTKGVGCPYCSNNKVLKGFNDISTTNPEILKEWNYDKNDKLKLFPTQLSHGSTKHVWWKCEHGHEYKMSLANKSKGTGCPICANQKLLKGFNDFATKHPKLLEEWDYEKNDVLGIKPDEIVLGGKIKVWWKCEKGHEWQAAINDRIRNNKLYNRCPICSSYLRTSIPEKIIYYYISKVYPKTIPNYKPDWLNHKEIDIFIPEINIGIEYDGYYYHRDIKKDAEKDNLCAENNVKLIRIREKKAKPIKTNAVIYNIKIDNNVDYTYIEDALEFLNNYLHIDMQFNVSRDIDKILSMIEFMEKENCISKTNPEVLNEWDYEKNNIIGITPDNVSNGSSLKVWWKCEKGHSYKATISTKINQSTGCPYCTNKTVLSGFNDVATTNPELLKEWDFEKNDKLGIKPDKITKGYGKKVWWKCSLNHSYDTFVNNRIRGDSCPYCSGHRVMSGFNDIATSNPELLEEWDFEKNDKLGFYMKNYTKGNVTKVWWKCDKGHSYQATINSRTSPKKTKCPYCSGQKVLKGFNDVATTNPELIREWDLEKNKIKPDEISKGSRSKIWWKCPKEHSYQANIPNRLRGTKCPYCSGNKILVGFNDLETTHPEVLKNWDYEKNEKMGITPNNVSKSYSKKVWWKCEKGHSYLREIYNQRNGYGKCPICKKNKKI